ncbi:MAG: hypothetical protein Q8Q60_03330 [Candidatus Chromulinivorax sp.]|nr:hypothetical protein [Candidatus Chromulinivorax sp.]
MKNLRIITLTAICMMTGVSLLEAARQSSMIVSNETSYPIQVTIKSVYKKTKNGGRVTRHDNKTITVAAGKKEAPIKGTINFDGGVEKITVINMSNTNPSTQQKTTLNTKIYTSDFDHAISGTINTKTAKEIVISDDKKTSGKPVITALNTKSHKNT